MKISLNPLRFSKPVWIRLLAVIGVMAGGTYATYEVQRSLRADDRLEAPPTAFDSEAAALPIPLAGDKKFEATPLRSRRFDADRSAEPGDSASIRFASVDNGSRVRPAQYFEAEPRPKFGAIAQASSASSPRSPAWPQSPAAEREMLEPSPEPPHFQPDADSLRPAVALEGDTVAGTSPVSNESPAVLAPHESRPHGEPTAAIGRSISDDGETGPAPRMAAANSPIARSTATDTDYEFHGTASASLGDSPRPGLAAPRDVATDDAGRMGAGEEPPPAAAFTPRPAASGVRLGDVDQPSPSTAPTAPQTPGQGRPGRTELAGAQNPTLVLEKSAPPEIKIGEPATFTLRIRNVGQVNALGVIVRDEVPQGTRLIQTTPVATSGGDAALLWQLGVIPAGEERTVEMTVMPAEEGEVGSVATVAFQAQVTVSAKVSRPALEIEHMCPRRVHIGEDVPLKIRVHNPGTGTVTNVKLEEDVPEGLAHASGPELEFEVGSLAPGETREIELTLKAAVAGVITNTITAHADANLIARHSAQLEVIAPTLQVAMRGPGRRFLERPADYTVVVANPGTAPATNVMITAHLPRGMKFVGTNNAGAYDASQHVVRWSLAELPADQMGETKLTLLPIETGDQSIRLEGHADMGLTHTCDQEVSVEALASLAFEVIDTADPIEVGADTIYEIRVTNEGSKSASNVTLAAELPPQMRPLAGEGPSRGGVAGQQVLFEPLPRLAPQSEAVYKIRVQGLAAGRQRIRVQLTSEDQGTPVTKEESTLVYSDQ